MISTITFSRVLPLVFSRDEDRSQHAASQVWLKDEVVFRSPGTYMIEAESGTGKSSLCAYIYGERIDYEGEIRFDGESVRGYSPERWCELRRSSLAYLPQEMRLFPELSVMDNILLKNRLTDYHTTSEILALLERLEVDHKASEPAGRLSIGQQQRVATVRALCQPFDFLLVDEPVSHLDSRNNLAVASLIADEASARDAAIIATSVGNQLSLTDFTLMRL